MYILVNDNDPNDRYQLDADNIADAYENAITMLGYYIVHEDDDENNNMSV